MAASAGAQQPLRGASLTPEAAALGLGSRLGSPLRRGAASLVCPTRPAPDVSFGGGLNPAAASLLGAASSQQGIADGMSLLGGEGLGGNEALYRALLNRKLQEESAALAAAGLGAGAGLMGRMNPSLLSRPGEASGPSDPMRQEMMREQTIAQAAAANAALAKDEEGPAKKKSKKKKSRS